MNCAPRRKGRRSAPTSPTYLANGLRTRRSTKSLRRRTKSTGESGSKGRARYQRLVDLFQCDAEMAGRLEVCEEIYYSAGCAGRDQGTLLRGNAAAAE